jgi:3-isopropylmalate/(R)-2-methylmalate dehydratase small subunit
LKTALIKGSAWKFKNNVDTDEIYPAKYLAEPNPEQWGHHVMEPISPGFAAKIKKGDIIVAGENFGCGSSREHAAIALKLAGIGAIVAESQARIFFRNAINNGLPALECPGISRGIEEGNDMEVDLTAGQIRNLSTGAAFQFSPLPDFLVKMLTKGGLISYLSEK